MGAAEQIADQISVPLPKGLRRFAVGASLLRAGVRVFEYEPGMTHAKALIVDNLWAVIGTTNFDNRSFEHNDEVNLAVRDAHVAERLMVDFEADLSRSREILAEGWQARPLWEKLVGTVAWILERQQ